jgi:DNA-directed RNA polymerase subunit D
MKVEINNLDKKQNKLTFTLSDVNPPYANALRRIMSSEVPTMAIEDVEIRKNNSISYDEVLAHRLGLIPLTTDLKAYNLIDDCTCKGAGCAKCTLKLTLSVKGPKKVVSGDLKSQDPKVIPVDDKYLIATLIENQEIEVVATAVLGKGKVHSKWSPGHMVYKYSPKIKINKQPKNPKAIQEICPFDVFDVKKDKLEVANEQNCTLCNACTDVLKDNEITVTGDDTKFIFEVESFGQLDPREIVQNAVSVFNDKIKDFETQLK